MKNAARLVSSFGIRFVFSAEMAGRGIVANPLRSLLTILGVAIGVASVTSLMGIGEGARQAVVRQFASLGSNVVVVKAQEPSAEFQPGEAGELVERVVGLELGTPVLQTQAPIRWRRTRGVAEIVGVNEQFPRVRDHPLTAGRFFTKWHVEQRSPVAVLGYTFAAGLQGGRSPVGQTFTLGGQTFRIVGVLAPKGTGKGEGIDDKILIPYTTAQKIAGKKTVEELWVKAKSPQEAELAVVQMGRIFRRKLGLDQTAPTPVPPEGQKGEAGPAPGKAPPMVVKPMGPGMERAVMIGPGGQPGQPGSKLPTGGKDLVTITSLNQLVKEADRANRVMTLLLGGIAAVSLLVGGLGIMNIMLVAVTERTGEIGVRRALGAKRGDLLVQFLLEALYLSAIGSLAGIGAGLWGMQAFARYGLETAVSLQAIEIATGIALGAGLLFGVYPALSASSVPPVQALRR
ncbi:MAG: ABC transporter permease [Actinobacteria bacterium]|nr:ABC transporter permease [Actinomycetota bacterium]